MSNHQKSARSAFVAGLALAAALAAGSASAQDLQIGKGARLNLQGEVANQVAAAIGHASRAHNVAGGITSSGALSIGEQVQIDTRAKVTGPLGQIAVAGFPGTSASNNAGGVLAMGGSLLSR